MSIEVHPVTRKWQVTTERSKKVGTTVYIVFDREGTVSPAQAEVAAGVPSIGDPYPDSSGNFPCVKRTAVCTDEARQVCEVTCDYDSTQEVVADVLATPTRIEYSYEISAETYFKDRRSPNPYYAQYTNLLPFDQLPQRDGSTRVITITKVVASTTTLATYSDFDEVFTNSGSVTIDGVTYAAGTLKGTPPVLSAVQEQDGTLYRQLVTTLRYRKAGWNDKYESRGVFELAGGVLSRIADDDGVPVESTWPLNADGSKKSNPATPGAEIDLQPYPSVSITSLL